jgi:hypothetical protein
MTDTPDKMVTVTTLATIRNEHSHVTLARSDTGQLMLTSWDDQLKMGTCLFLSRGELLKWARAIIKAVAS